MKSKTKQTIRHICGCIGLVSLLGDMWLFAWLYHICPQAWWNFPLCGSCLAWAAVTICSSAIMLDNSLWKKPKRKTGDEETFY